MQKQNKKRSLFALIVTAVAAITFLYWYGERWLRRLLIYLSHADWARQLVTATPLAWRVASRFVAGEDIASAIAAARELNAKGMHVTLDVLGEHVGRPADAVAARDAILALLDRIAKTDVNATVSIKLSQLGLKIDETLALESAHAIVARAQEHNNRIRIDMEESQLVDKTLTIYRTLRHEHGLENVGVVIQSYLYRSEKDVAQLVAEGASVRLCKGAYAEPAHIAFPDKTDTDANFIKLMEMMLSEKARRNGVYLGVATHDDDMIRATINYANGNHIPKDAYEFQMLYGVRRDLQEQLVAQGYQMRIYVPFGTAWYPYFVRRLAERPANLWFFISNFFRR